MKKRYLLLPIKPQHLVDILNGKKTIEIRKYMPKCDLPIEVLCYCTKQKQFWHVGCMGYYSDDLWYHPVKKIYICDDSCELMCLPEGYTYTKDNFLNKKVVAKFTLKNIDDLSKYANKFKDGFFYETLEKACVNTEYLQKYTHNKPILYAWHIDNLVIFDKPKELSEYGIKQAPKKYCYVYENEEEK